MISLKYFTRFRLDFGLWIVMHDQPPLSYTKPVTVYIAVTLPIDVGKLSQYPTYILFQKECIWVSETKKVMLIK